MKTINKLWLGLVILILLSPLGIIIPEKFKAGSAWGEWGVDEIQKIIGYIPRGLEKLAGLWKAPIPDYTLPGPFGYILSAIIGVLAVAVVAFVLGKILSAKKDRR